MYLLSQALLKQLWPHASSLVIAGVSAASQEGFAHYGMTKIEQIQDFMAECSEETGGGMAFVESGAYSAERAHDVWPSLFPTIQSAQVVVGNPKALFNKTYGDRLGNRPGTDDGYDFRGRGMIQITGRTWYTMIAKETSLDLVNHPDLVAEPENLLECALAFWKLDKVNDTVGNLRAEVKRINGGYTNMAAREAWEATCQKLITEATATYKGPIIPVQGIGEITPPPKPPILVSPAPVPNATTTGEPILHPTFKQEFEAFLKRWL